MSEEVKVWILLALIFLVIMAFPPRAQACDCAWYAYERLGRLGIRLKTVPAITVDHEIRFPGIYANDVVTIKDPANCHVVLHEFVHHAQKGSKGDWFSKERDAVVLSAYAAMEGSCQ